MDLLRRSIELIERSQDRAGSYPASPTFRVYRYCWIRDGAFIAEAMDAAGHHDSAAAFHRWVTQVVLRYRDRVEALDAEVPEHLDDTRILHPRFTASGDEVTEPWSNFQLDGYGFWLTSVARHVGTGGTDPADLAPAVSLVARYLTLLWDRPCADCWEEHPDRRHPTTVAAVAAGLRHAALLLNDPEPAATADRARQWIIEHGTASGPGGPSLAKFQGSPDVDGSALLVLGPYGQLGPEDPVATGTLARVEAQLVRDGGVHRYLDDAFYGGGLWVPLAGALALVRVRMGDPAGAGEALAWIERAAEGPENLPEQVPSHLRHPQELSRWEEVWGPSASPLLWSHAMYVLARRAMDAAGADAGDAGHTRSG